MDNLKKNYLSSTILKYNIDKVIHIYNAEVIKGIEPSIFER